MRPEPVDPAGPAVDDVVALVADRQRDPATAIAYLGVEPDGIRAELDALSPPWTSTLRVVRDPTGALLGAALLEWDEELGRSWVFGPWVAPDAERPDEVAAALLDAVLAQAPRGVTRHELSGDVANTGLARLAAARGWRSTVVNHALVLDAATAARWPEPEEAFPTATAADAEAVRALHDAEFPEAYSSAEQLVTGDGIVLVARGGDGAVVGYAAGQVQPDGEGYIDFVAVDPAARGTGIGRRLVVALSRALLARCTTGRVNLTVQSPRVAARALYASLGFRGDGDLVGYRSWE